MSLTLTSNYSAVVPTANFVQFLASGGAAPYTYQVMSGGAGGAIDSSLGFYTAPDTMTAYPPSKLFDTVQATDSLGATGTSQVMVATPLFLICDIIHQGMGLDPFHCFLWDQKVFQPTDSGLYVTVALSSCKPFSNSFKELPDGTIQQYTSMYGRIDFDAISRGPAARDQKELIILALNSFYSQSQQTANGFYLGKVPIMGGFINLSQIDGDAIPYRYKISFAIQYTVALTNAVPYYDTFPNVEVYEES